MNEPSAQLGFSPGLSLALRSGLGIMGTGKGQVPQMRRRCSRSMALLRPRAGGVPSGGLLLTYILRLVNSSDAGLLRISITPEGGVINVAGVT